MKENKGDVGNGCGFGVNRTRLGAGWPGDFGGAMEEDPAHPPVSGEKGDGPGEG